MRSRFVCVYDGAVGLGLNRQQEGLVLYYYLLVFTLEVHDRVVDLYQWLFALPPSPRRLLADARVKFELKILHAVRLKEVSRFGYFVDHVISVVETVLGKGYLNRSSSTLFSCWLSLR